MKLTQSITFVEHLDTKPPLSVAFDDSSLQLQDSQEFSQLALRVKEIMSFRNWCSQSHPKDLQLAFSKNGVSLAKQTTDLEESVSELNERENYGNANGQNRNEGIETSS